MEDLLHYTWKHRIFPLNELFTTEGESLEIIDTGQHNRDAGPDFFNAKIRIDGTLWVGNVEVHLKSSDWYAHRHHTDKSYNNVILHVVGKDDKEPVTENGRILPQFILPCPETVLKRYAYLKQTSLFPPCIPFISDTDLPKIRLWINSLAVERLEQKTEEVRLRWEEQKRNWDESFFITLARNFGFGINGDAFEYWAKYLPFGALRKHRDNLTCIEAIFFGYAGLLEQETDDKYHAELRQEFAFMKRKFELELPEEAPRWMFARLRPGNFPTVRIAQLARLIHNNYSIFSRAMEEKSLKALKKLFKTGTSAYWKRHYNFGKESPLRTRQPSERTLELIIINTVVPFLYAYGRHTANEEMCERAMDLLEKLKAENNHITRRWEKYGISVKTATGSQALIQLEKQYCMKKECLRCSIGYELLKIHKNNF